VVVAFEQPNVSDHVEKHPITTQIDGKAVPSQITVTYYRLPPTITTIVDKTAIRARNRQKRSIRLTPIETKDDLVRAFGDDDDLRPSVS